MTEKVPHRRISASLERRSDTAGGCEIGQTMWLRYRLTTPSAIHWASVCWSVGKEASGQRENGPYNREIEFDEVLVSDRIEHIATLLKKKKQITFNDIFSFRPSVGEIIASFLAILEMTKGKQIKIMQYMNFGDIIILRNY